MKKGILLINLGTPDSPSVSDVRKYLREFLMDKYVIDMPVIPRWILVNIIIATFRAPKSAEAYKLLWTEKGSPLLFHSLGAAQNLQKELGNEYIVELGMRYGNPSIESAIKKLMKAGITQLHVIPMYPQYASSTSLSSIEKTKDVLSRLGFKGEVSFTMNFFDNPAFINGLATNGKKHLEKESFDHILFSYHGIPERHITKDDKVGCCKLNDSCCTNYNAGNKLCYRAQSIQTSLLLAKELNLNSEQYSTVFQSRLITRAREPWLQPYADEVITDLAKQGKKKLLVFSPAFVADCLETTVEIGIEYQELFEENGGDKIQLVESLNTNHQYLLSCIKK